LLTATALAPPARVNRNQTLVGVGVSEP